MLLTTVGDKTELKEVERQPDGQDPVAENEAATITSSPGLEDAPHKADMEDIMEDIDSVRIAFANSFSQPAAPPAPTAGTAEPAEAPVRDATIPTAAPVETAPPTKRVRANLGLAEPLLGHLPMAHAAFAFLQTQVR